MFQSQNVPGLFGLHFFLASRTFVLMGDLLPAAAQNHETLSIQKIIPTLLQNHNFGQQVENNHRILNFNNANFQKKVSIILSNLNWLCSSDKIRFMWDRLDHKEETK
jgi:hypothetical protein